MALIVQKYGGTSVGTLERIQRVAQKIATFRNQGHDVVVAVSAMSGETDRLTEMAFALANRPAPREVDVLLSTGEQVTIALLGIALQALGIPARSYTGAQVKIETDTAHNKARILSVQPERIRADLAQGRVVVVAGFQGADVDGNITTLGRGGSDTTAVALAAALEADECQVYTDVDGVYTTDPRIEPNARRLDRITFEEMLELASLGSKVLQIRAVELAGKYAVPLRVLSTFEEGPGTLITLEDYDVEEPLVTGIAIDQDQTQLTVLGVPDRPGIAYSLLGPIGDANIEVDMILQNVSGDASTDYTSADFTFTVHQRDYNRALELLQAAAEQMGAREVSGNTDIAKLSLVGVGMRSHAGVASKMFRTLAEENINIRMISTTEIKISVVILSKYKELAVRALHEAFELDKAGPAVHAAVVDGENQS